MIRPYWFFSKVVADTAGEYASPELAEDLEEADGPKIFYVGEFSSFVRRDEPALFPEVWNVLGGPQCAEHVVCGLVEVFKECLQVSVGETSHTLGIVLFVRRNGLEVVLI